MWIVDNSGGEDEVVTTGTRVNPWVTSISVADTKALFSDFVFTLDLPELPDLRAFGDAGASDS